MCFAKYRLTNKFPCGNLRGHIFKSHFPMLIVIKIAPDRSLALKKLYSD
jgi:hypothetical protein